MRIAAVGVTAAMGRTAVQAQSPAGSGDTVRLSRPGSSPHTPQRLAMYIVISIPNRKSVACGVSHFIKMLLMQ
jgi:hypothetical protein